MASYRPKPNPAVLAWARKSSRLSEDRAAALLEVSIETLLSWEAGTQAPTIIQLRKIGEKYRRPVGAFFLDSPPLDPAPPHDFRKVHGAAKSAIGTALIHEFRRAVARREIALELLTDLEQKAPVFKLAATLRDDPEAIGKKVREHLGIKKEDQRRWGDEQDAFNGWKRAVESTGLLVFQMRGVSYKEARGFSVAERVLPIIVVNGTDFPNAKTFTLMHELIHVLLRTGGICDPYGLLKSSASHDNKVEAFCNRAAAAALVPKLALLNHPDVAGHDGLEDWTDEALRRIARTFGVSTLVILRRLLGLERTTSRFYKRHQTKVFSVAEQNRKTRATGQEGAPPRPVMVISDLGRSFPQTVMDAYNNRLIPASDVAEYFRVKVPQIAEVQTRLRVGA